MRGLSCLHGRAHGWNLSNQRGTTSTRIGYLMCPVPFKLPSLSKYAINVPVDALTSNVLDMYIPQQYSLCENLILCIFIGFVQA